jgi:hypothetical protein
MKHFCANKAYGQYRNVVVLAELFGGVGDLFS